MNVNEVIIGEVNSHANYLKWKRENVTYRGINNDEKEENGGGALLGQGLYTAYLSNKSMARGYGKVYFLVGAKPKNPKVFNTLNDWEIWFYNTLVFSYSKAKGKTYPDRKDFDSQTSISEELQKMGYDGIAIRGREMVNFTPEEDKIMYFENENQLYRYWEFKFGNG